MPRNDDALAKIKELQALAAEKAQAAKVNILPPFLPITKDKLSGAKLTPQIIVPHYLYADVRMRVAAGGTGKTTLALYEAMQLALGRELWGNKPSRPGKTVIVTKEDDEEVLSARLREIMKAHDLTEDEVEIVLDGVRIYDLTRVAFRLSCIIGDVVEVHEANVEDIVERLFDFKPDWIIFDPLVSFGVGEGRVNDAEQGLIEAFRFIKKRLNCCVEGIHHTGKANARDKTSDQYSGRGGSALADGSRMVAVLNPVTPADWNKECGAPLGQDESGLRMSLAKLSYCAAQDDIFIRRKGYHFEHEVTVRRTPAQVADAVANQVHQFILDQYRQGRFYSKSDLEAKKDELSLSRDAVRAAITELSVSGRVTYDEVKGKSGSHFVPVE